jgi:GT2 family glycosyltransferase
VHDLAIIIVSTNEARWLGSCLDSVYRHAGDIDLAVVVADNESTDGTRELVEERFPQAHVVTCSNRGFAHANNCGLQSTAARYSLFLNPDTEVLEGTFQGLVAALDRRPTVGLAGVKQVTPDGELFPTVRRFPNAFRTLAEALGSERLPIRGGWLGERELRLDRYDEELGCDWTSGSFMIARCEALESAGYLDERFFIYSEEPDLCLRMKQAGWEVRHLPSMTILHHADKAGANPRMAAQDAYARLQYARKHLSRAHRTAYRGALLVRWLLRFAAGGPKRSSARAALGILVGRAQPPFGAPPAQAVVPRRHRVPAGAR